MIELVLDPQVSPTPGADIGLLIYSPGKVRFNTNFIAQLLSAVSLAYQEDWRTPGCQVMAPCRKYNNKLNL